MKRPGKIINKTGRALLMIMGFLPLRVHAQKPTIDTTILFHWPQISEGGISKDGKFAYYTVQNWAETKGSTIFKSISSRWRKQYRGITNIRFADQNELAICQQDSTLLCIHLGTGLEDRYEHTTTYDLIHCPNQEFLIRYTTYPQQKAQLIELRSGTTKTLTGVQRCFPATNEGSLYLIRSSHTGHNEELCVFYLTRDTVRSLWKGDKIESIKVDGRTGAVAFKAGLEYRYWKTGMNQTQIIASGPLKGANDKLMLGDIEGFHADGTSLLFYLKPVSVSATQKGNLGVNIWSYDRPLLPLSLGKFISPEPDTYLAMIRLVQPGVIIPLQRTNEPATVAGISSYTVVLDKRQGQESEYLWSTAAQPNSEVIDLTSNERHLVPLNYNMDHSPDDRFLLFRDNELSYYILNKQTGKIVAVNNQIPVPPDTTDIHRMRSNDKGLVPTRLWLNQGRQVVFNDGYDLWSVDPLGVSPSVCLTNHYGRKHGLTFDINRPDEKKIVGSDLWVLATQDIQNKDNGFYQIDLRKPFHDPKKLSMGRYDYYHDSDAYAIGDLTSVKSNSGRELLFRASTDTSPNLFWTSDHRRFYPVSDIRPERKYNWIVSSLRQFNTKDGRIERGALYRPEDLDEKKKYPVIIFYYEEKSSDINKYPVPGYPAGGELDIAWFVSHGYAVFTPDIHYTIGATGQNVLNTIDGAYEYLRTIPWVDSAHIGLQGHSFGAWETNQVIAHTDHFAAAISSSGVADMVSSYNNTIFWTAEYLERRGYRGGGSLWEKPDFYLNNSPVLFANRVNTPVLLLANPNDHNVPFTQGLEFFLALRRNGKKAWMLSYDNQLHGLFEPASKMDFIIRSTQFFDYYLKGAPAPKWMVEGIPANQKGIDDGYELEPKGVGVGPGLLTPEAQRKVDSLQNRKPVTVILK